jgi:Kef-type K+ transport system membrane component KefB
VAGQISAGPVIVLAVAAGVPLLLGLLPGARLPGPLLEIHAGIVLGPSVLALLGLSFLLFLPGYEVDLRRFRGASARRVALSPAISAVVAAAVVGLLLLDPATGAGLVAAGLVSVLVFPAVALTLLPRAAPVPV